MQKNKNSDFVYTQLTYFILLKKATNGNFIQIQLSYDFLR